ncbi:MAG TPA: phospholipase D-like domain-containing protein [Burkholderiales bacterium]|nr:phospholipase D-like domain-containing protein [Burkholderiales bacterium]
MLAEDATSTETSIFKEGHNCRRIAKANRVALLVDGEDYFSAFMQAAVRARESIIIIAWDFNSRARLSFDGRREELGDFLNRLAKRNRDLRIYILDWDFPMIYATDREVPASIKLGWGWRPHRRVNLKFDNTHPPGGSHHQKIIVIDDAIAFCGGLDLTCQRWDTSAHAPGDSRRMTEDKPYPPFHDTMIAVDGEAARELGHIARERWRCSTKEDIPAVRARHDPWPPELKPDVTDIAVAISCTAPECEPHAEAREIEALYLDMIARATRYIYIENQYFTAHKIGEALAARLAEPHPPEIVVVTRLLSHGWLEENTMGVLRNRLIERLRKADRQGRFQIYYPHMPGLEEGTCIDVHSKMMAVDDEWLRVGSANLNNRSMGFDTECDIAIEARGDERVARAIRGFRDRLIAEHLGVEVDRVAREIPARGSIHAAIGTLQREGRTLKALTELKEYPDVILDLAAMTDPERAVGLDRLIEEFLPPGGRQPFPWLKIGAFFALSAGLMAAWRLASPRLRAGTRKRRWMKAR